MQRMLTTSSHRFPRTLHRAGRAAALAVVLALGASACGDAGLDLGDDSARVGKDEEVGQAGNGDDDDAGAPEEMVAPEPEPSPAMTDSPGDSSDPEEDPVPATPQAPMVPGFDPNAPTLFPQPTAIGMMPAPVGQPTPVMTTFPPPSNTVTPTPMCPPGRGALCNGQCANLLEDLENCGACGLVCDSGLSCIMGTCSSACGNGILEGMETCDDGNATANDGCDGACQVEAAFVCSTPGEPCLVAECGDGVIEDEQCDDGNAVRGDGCFRCEVEEGWVCEASIESDAGAASSTCASICGDGVVTGAEQCDPGEQSGEGDCSVDCRSTLCGNMVCDANEDEFSCAEDCALPND